MNISMDFSGLELISMERTRQPVVEGFDDAHDDREAPGAMAVAACVYGVCAASSPGIREQLRDYSRRGIAPRHWPTAWAASWWKPGKDDSDVSRIRELTKAGALLAAEIDRLQRKRRREA